MKKILVVLFLIFISSIVFFQYKSYKKYNPPSYFNYAINDSIDVNYFDPVIVQQYYENAYQLGSFARQLWVNKGIDINFLDENKGGVGNSFIYYRTLIATTKRLERLLLESHNLKVKGFTNSEIKRIVEEGVSPEKIRYQEAIESSLYLDQLKLGDVGQNVWALQKILITKGYDIPKDGSFGSETQNAIKDFQEKNDLYPSGTLNVATIKELVK